MRTKRGYNRETPVELLRDYKLFVIACEGSKREPEYFNVFRHISCRIGIDIVDEIVTEEEVLLTNPHKSAPKWVLDRAVKYIEKEGLNSEDDLWFVMDVDRWEIDQLHEIAKYCEDYPNWNIALSNPCFEVWLYFHKKENIVVSNSITCSDFKQEISTFDSGGYHKLRFLSSIQDAIKNAKENDTNVSHYFPKEKETKVYRLIESIIKSAGESAIIDFINNHIPKLIELEKVHVREKSRK